MFDLNKTPALEEVVVQDMASLFTLVQELPNYHHEAPNRVQSSAHAWMSWLPPQTTTAAAGVMNTTTVWRSITAVPSYFATVPSPTGPAFTVSPLFKYGRVTELWMSQAARAVDRNQTLLGQTTTDVNYHDVSDRESDCWMPENYHDKYNSKGRSAVRLVEVESSPNGRQVPNQDPPMDPFQQGVVKYNSLNDPTGTSTFQRSPAEKLATRLASKQDHLAEEKRRREVAFHEAFKFITERCTPTAPCSSCLDFCKRPLPEVPVGQLGALYVDDGDGPPVLRNAGDDEAALRKGARHGPKSKSSDYRGVTFYKRTGRWEAHIWHEAAQVYLGASATKEEAARAYDKAALMLCGPDVDINFKPESYQREMAYLYKLSKEQLVIYLRRDSRGYGAQATYPGVKHAKKHYQAMYGENLLGTYHSEEEAARAVYEKAVQDSFGALASLILDTHHVRNMPSYAAQRYIALYPEAVEAMQLQNVTKASASKSKRQSTSTSSQKKKKRSTRTAPEPMNPSSAPAAARATAATPDPGEDVQVIEEISTPPAARIRDRTWGTYLAHQRHCRHAACIKLMAQNPTPPNSWPQLQTHINNAPAPQLYPRIHAPQATTAWSSCQPVSALSTLSRTEPPATSSARHPRIPSTPSSAAASSRPIHEGAAQAGVVKFKLFNVEITARVEQPPAHGGDEGAAKGTFAGGVRDGFSLPPRKRCKMFTDEATPHAFVPYESRASQNPTGLHKFRDQALDFIV